jgi:hypothetical protein
LGGQAVPPIDLARGRLDGDDLRQQTFHAVHRRLSRGDGARVASVVATASEATQHEP